MVHEEASGGGRLKCRVLIAVTVVVLDILEFLCPLTSGLHYMMHELAQRVGRSFRVKQGLLDRLTSKITSWPGNFANFSKQNHISLARAGTNYWQSSCGNVAVLPTHFRSLKFESLSLS